MAETSRPEAEQTTQGPKAGKALLREMARMAEQDKSLTADAGRGQLGEHLGPKDVRAELLTTEEEGQKDGEDEDVRALQECAAQHFELYVSPEACCPLHHHAWSTGAVPLQDKVARLRGSLARALCTWRRAAAWEEVTDGNDVPWRLMELLRLLVGYTYDGTKSLTADEARPLLALKRVLDGVDATGLMSKCFVHPIFVNAGGPEVLKVLADRAADPVPGRGGLVGLMCRVLTGHDGGAPAPRLRPWVGQADVEVVLRTARAILLDPPASPYTLESVCLALKPLLAVPAVAARGWEVVGDAAQSAAASGALPERERGPEGPAQPFQELLREASVGAWAARTGDGDAADAEGGWELFLDQFRRSPAGFKLCAKHGEPWLRCRWKTEQRMARDEIPKVLDMARGHMAEGDPEGAAFVALHVLDSARDAPQAGHCRAQHEAVRRCIAQAYEALERPQAVLDIVVPYLKRRLRRTGGCLCPDGAGPAVSDAAAWLLVHAVRAYVRHGDGAGAAWAAEWLQKEVQRREAEGVAGAAAAVDPVDGAPAGAGSGAGHQVPEASAGPSAAGLCTAAQMALTDPAFLELTAPLSHAPSAPSTGSEGCGAAARTALRSEAVSVAWAPEGGDVPGHCSRWTWAQVGDVRDAGGTSMDRMVVLPNCHMVVLFVRGEYLIWDYQNAEVVHWITGDMRGKIFQKVRALGACVRATQYDATCSGWRCMEADSNGGRWRRMVQSS